MSNVYIADARSNAYLQNYGVKGMKWGVRRYQNADGSYTDAGRRRLKRERAIAYARLTPAQRAKHNSLQENEEKTFRTSAKAESDYSAHPNKYTRQAVRDAASEHTKALMERTDFEYRHKLFNEDNSLIADGYKQVSDLYKKGFDSAEAKAYIKTWTEAGIEEAMYDRSVYDLHRKRGDSIDEESMAELRELEKEGLLTKRLKDEWGL